VSAAAEVEPSYSAAAMRTAAAVESTATSAMRMAAAVGATAATRASAVTLTECRFWQAYQS
jgi:hypothetical protein